MNTQETCKARVRGHYQGRITDIRELWELYRKDCEASREDGSNWTEYGLGFDYIPAGTFTDQKRGFFRYQLSWGGPGDEFRFFVDENLSPTSIQYWFLDWFDGAHVCVNGKDRELLEEIWQDWKDCELPQSKMAEAMQA